MRTDGFTFKRFFVAHDKSPMRVTTDSVVLACWAPIPDQCQRILDVGTGCGVIALMMAQRTEKFTSPVIIDGVELDEQAVLQARDNAAHSPWPDRLRIIHDNIVNYASQHKHSYDFIIANPPYFSPGSECRTVERSRGRYTLELDYLSLLESVKQLLSPVGRFCLILPQSQAQIFQDLAHKAQWFMGQQLFIRHSADKPPRLQAFEISQQRLLSQQNILTLRDSNQGYSEQFFQLASDFQLFTNRSTNNNISTN